MAFSDWYSKHPTIGRLIAAAVILTGLWVLTVYVAVPCCVELAGNAPHQNEETNRWAEQSARCSDAVTWPIVPDDQQAKAATTANEESKPPSKVECEDLKAQRRMAVAAERLVALTCYQLGIGLLGTAVVGLTLFFTALATYAAVEGNKLGRKTLIADQRPWIEIVSIKVDGPLVFDAPPHTETAHLPIVLHLKNVGKSPALRLSFDLKLTIRDQENLLSQQKRYAKAVRAGVAAEKVAPSAVVLEHSIFQGRELETVRLTAWMDTTDLLKFRQLTQGLPALVGLIGCITYESPIDEDLHQTSIIRNVDNWMAVNEPRGALQLSGGYPQDNIVLRKSDVGGGPID
jgi:hypothetical protein